jgi:hypothetical protein
MGPIYAPQWRAKMTEVNVNVVFKSGAVLNVTGSEGRAMHVISAYSKFLEKKEVKTTRFSLQEGAKLNTVIMDFAEVLAISAAPKI